MGKTSLDETVKPQATPRHKSNLRITRAHVAEARHVMGVLRDCLP